jgi:hypothetical protein
MTALLTIMVLIPFAYVCYCIYQRQRSKNSHKQTRIVLREQFSDEERNELMIENIRKHCEYDVN